MLLHLCPRLYSPFKNVALIDLEISPLGLRLVGGVDLITRRPYPNNHHALACRKRGHNKAFRGILIETETPVTELHSVAHWAIDAEMVVTHRVHYRLLDNDFDAASDNMVLWYGTGAEDGGWSNRFPAALKGVPPMRAEPMMEVIRPNFDRPATEDTINKEGRIIERHQTFAMPTIERERLLNSKSEDRLPPFDTVFKL